MLQTNATLAYATKIPDGVDIDESTLSHGITIVGEGERSSDRYLAYVLLEVLGCYTTSLEPSTLTYSHDVWVAMNTLAKQHQLEPPELHLIGSIT